MQKDRNAQFMIAEVQEVMFPYPGQPQETEAKPIEEGRYLIENKEKIESEVKVSAREYIIQKDNSLSKIAKEQLGGAHRLYPREDENLKRRFLPGALSVKGKEDVK